MNSRRRRSRIQNSASSSTISGLSVRAIFRTKNVVLLPTSTESDVLRGERKSLLMSHGFIRNELEIDKSWSKHEVRVVSSPSKPYRKKSVRRIQKNLKNIILYSCHK